MKNPFAMEDRFLGNLDFKRGRLPGDSTDPVIQNMAALQKKWLEAAEDDQNQLVEDKVITDFKKDQAEVEQEEERRYEAKQFEYQEKILATIGVMQLFDKSKAEIERGLVVTPLSRFDQLMQNCDFILSFDDNQALAVYVGTALDNQGAEKKAKQSVEAARHGETEQFQAAMKYLLDDDLRGKTIPRVEIHLAKGEANKLAVEITSNMAETDLTDKEKELKVFIKTDIEKQLSAIRRNLEFYINQAKLGEGVEPTKLEQAKQLAAAIERFFKKFNA